MLAASAQTLTILFLSGLLAIVIFRLLAGRINTRGLLEDKRAGKPGNFSPGRLQLLIATFGGAAFYFSEIVGAAEAGVMPPVPDELLLIVGVSNVAYLGGKIYSKFFNTLN